MKSCNIKKYWYINVFYIYIEKKAKNKEIFEKFLIMLVDIDIFL